MEELSIDVMIQVVLKWVLEKYVLEGLDWANLAQDGDRWRAAMNTVMNLQDP